MIAETPRAHQVKSVGVMSRRAAQPSAHHERRRPYAGHGGVRPEYVMTNRMSSSSSFLKRFVIASVVGSASSQSPTGALLPVIGIQLLPLDRRVLVTPSIESAKPPTGA